MIYIISILILLFLFFSFNLFLTKRSYSHSNKFVFNIIRKTWLNKFIKPQIVGWSIKTFRTDKKLTNLSNKDLSLRKWYRVNMKDCGGIADPFLFKQKDTYYLFFEYEYHKSLKKGADIAYATSIGGENWTFQSIILQEPFHQSFPNVFEKDGEIYMLPESYQSNQVRLYKASNFPNDWKLEKILFEGKRLVDTIFLKKEDVYFWLTTDLETNQLELYYSMGFDEKWIEHPSSPISVVNKNNRNAGAIIEIDDKVYRPAQDGTLGYGSGVNLYEIKEISIESYREKIITEPMFFKNKKQIKDAIHHLSLINEDKMLIAVDGANFATKSIKIG